MKDIITSDIVLAAYLRVERAKMADIHLLGGKGEFHFTNVDEEVLAKYDLGEGRVEPVQFNQAIRHLTTAVNRLKRSYS